ncbi:GFA family protein [Erythrobacter sp. YT30]|uniref:GFA family protein n=1 Tax=Erythrobacter sp. YT30 TaxID=1735012 RepID=UPI000AF99E9B|nr:GFA family protein [Erythrobacter sp. YT30]
MSEMFGEENAAAGVGVLDEPLTGKCLCGAVSITVQSMRREVDVCHCEMCRRNYGSFAAMVAGADFTIDGEDSVGTYKSSDWAERCFCKNCGSALFYRFIPTNFYSFAAGHFELPEGLPIKQQIFVDEKPDWYDLAQKSPMKTGAEIIAEAEASGISFE